MTGQNQYFPQSRPHPGETLAEKLEEMEMGPKEFSLRTGKPEKTIIAVLKGDSSITPDMAVQFEYVTQIPAGFWMNHQRAYDEFIAREKHKAVVQAAADWAKRFPMAEMIQKGWLPPAGTRQEKTQELLAFFGFAHPTAWEAYYFKQQLKVAFRISLAQTKAPYAISAWLRKGELQAAQLEAGGYSAKRFRDALPQIKSLMAGHPDGFFHRLHRICLNAGVKVVHTPCLDNTPIHGSTRWIKDTPLIQLTGRYPRHDGFWFTFFHEAGHILLHGKKDVFLEKLDYSDMDKKKEQEADVFAKAWTLTGAEEAALLAVGHRGDPCVQKPQLSLNQHPRRTP